jgi:hypothetical protein
MRNTKKPAVIFGNCQAAAIARVLADHTPFTARYEILPCRAVHVLTAPEKASLQKAVASAELFIHQPVSDIYAPASTSALLAALSPEAEALSFPVCWFDGYFPDMVTLKGPTTGRFAMAYHSRLFFTPISTGSRPPSRPRNTSIGMSMMPPHWRKS